MNQHRAAAIRVGTASWSEPEFVKAGWYPPGLPAGERLAFYAESFNTVELNCSFYAIPRAAMCECWVQQTPDEFVFDVKLHRLLSRHATKADALPPELRRELELDGRDNVILTAQLQELVAERFLDEIKPLERAGKLGALLLQMTPGFAPQTSDLTALEGLLQQLKGSGQHPRKVVLELRHHDWLNERYQGHTINFLREHEITLASIDGPPVQAGRSTIMPTVDKVTAPTLAYLRLHGRDSQAYLNGKTVAERFNYQYSEGELDEIFDRSLRLSAEADELHVIFNNNARDFALLAASGLRRRLGQVRSKPKRLPPPVQGVLF